MNVGAGSGTGASLNTVGGSKAVQERAYLDAVVPLERRGHWRAVKASYEAAVERWPDNLVALMGLGNSRYVLGDRRGAVAPFRAARRAVELAGDKGSQYRQTLSEIEVRVKS